MIFSLQGYDNDSYAFCDRDGLRRCSQCGNLTHKWEETLDELRVHKRRSFDISATYDGVLVVSARFARLCQDHRFENVILRCLPDDLEYYSIRSALVVEFDAERRRTRFEGLCEWCGTYDEVAGAHPVMLKPNQRVPPSSFARTDIEFGSGEEKHPLLFCGADVATVLRSSGLKGLELEAIMPPELS